MNIIFKLALLVGFILNANATQEITNNIAKISASSLYNIDKSALQATVDPYINNKNNIKALKIVELLSNEAYISVYKDENGELIQGDIPKNYDRYHKYRSNVYYEKEKVGEVIAYFKDDLYLEFTTKEKTWLKNNPMIKIAVMNYWNSDDEGNNIHKDFLKLLNKYGNITFLPVGFDAWKDGFNKAIKGEDIHGIMNLSYSKEREEKYFHYTLPYDFQPNFLITKKSNNTINSLDDLKGKTVYIKQKAITRKIVEEKSKEIKIIELKNETQMFENLSSTNEADAMISYATTKNVFEQYDLKLVKRLYNKYSQLYIGVGKGHEELRSIIDKIMQVIPKSELSKIQNKIYKKDRFTIPLTKEEKLWISKNPTVKITKFFDEPPFTLNNEKKEGYVYEIIEFLLQSASLKPKYINGYNSYGSMLESLEKNEVSILTTFPTSLDLGKDSNILKSKSILKTPFVLIGKTNQQNISSLKELYGKKVAVVKGYMQDKYLSKFPEIEKIYVNNNDEGFKAIREEKASYYINNRANTEYILNKSFSTDLKIIYELPYKHFPSLSISFAMNKNNKILNGILKKALEQIPYKTISKIKEKWIINKKTQSNISLNHKEKAWVKNNTIKVGVEQWAPVIFSNDGKDIDGISGDILKLVLKRTGLKVELVHNLWDPLLNSFKDKKIDLLPATYYTKQRAKYGLYSSGYYKMLDYIYVKESNNLINSMEDLKGKTLAIPTGFGTIEKIKEKYPQIKIVNTVDLADSIARVLKGEIDALYDGQLAVEYHIQENLIQGLKGIPQRSFEAAKLHFFTSIDKPILKSILQKGLDSITREEKRNIISKWIDLKNKVKLSDKEQIWLDKKIPIRYVYDPDWAPFEWKNDIEKHSGIISDILSIIENRSGLKLVPVNVEKWSEAVIKAKNREVDMYSGVNQTLEKSTYMNFTKKSIYQTPYVFVTRLNDTNDYFDTFKAVKNKKVAVVNGYSIHDTLLKEKKDFPIIAVKSTKEGFEKLQDKEIDVFVVNAATAKYYMNRLGYDNLRIATKTKYNLDLKIAIRKDWPKEVVSIIDKTMGTITQKELDDIYHKWTQVIVKKKTDWSLLIQIAGGGILIIGFILYNNRQLKLKVDQKTAEIKTLLKSFDKNVIASKTDKKGNIIYASEAFCEISGYTLEELLGNNHRIVRHPDMPKEVFVNLWKTIKANETWRGEIKNRRKDGSFYWVDVIISPECDPDGEFCGYSAIRQDITAQKEVEELSKTLEQRVEDRTKELNDERKYINAIMNSQTNIVISSDGKCLRTANKAFLDFYNIKDTDEFIEKFGDCICDTFDTNNPNEFVQKMMGDEKWLDYVYERPDQLHKAKIIRNDREYIFTITADKFSFKGAELKTAVFNDITEIEAIRKNIEMILSNILLPILITSKETRRIIYANKYAQQQYEKPINELVGMDIDDIYSFKGQHNHILNAIEEQGKVEGFEEIFKTSSGKEFTALLNVTPISYNDQEAYIGMVTDITKQKEIEKEIRLIHKHTRESIEYASLIQGSLIPDNELFRKYFKEYFTIWHPKDVVGGDIYLFDELRDEDECMLMVIDCTGHGVPGAFVTMLVKAIERQIAAIIASDPHMEVSPAWCLEYFNKNMKKLLQQEGDDSISNAGFDGQILYYNKREQIIKFASARNELFYIQDGEITTIKGDRHSIGYKDSDANYKFKEHIIDVSIPTSLYISSDGYWDQLGGPKELSFGKKRLKRLIDEIKDESMAEQQEEFLYTLHEYQGDMERQDDVTVVGFKIEPEDLSNKEKNVNWSI